MYRYVSWKTKVQGSSDRLAKHTVYYSGNNVVAPIKGDHPLEEGVLKLFETSLIMDIQIEALMPIDDTTNLYQAPLGRILMKDGEPRWSVLHLETPIKISMPTLSSYLVLNPWTLSTHLVTVAAVRRCLKRC